MTKTDRVLSSFLRAVLLRMKALGLNQTQLAKRLDVARPYVSKVLQGDVNITFGAACRLAKALEMDFSPTLTAKEVDVRGIDTGMTGIIQDRDQAHDRRTFCGMSTASCQQNFFHGVRPH